MKRFLTLFAFLILCFFASAQAVAPLGQTPPSLKWRQIQTHHFQIIYPTEIEKDAQRIANAMDNAYYDVAASLKTLPRKIPIVMQNQTTDNNAFVSSEGRRAEFFSTPPQNPNNMGMNNWYDELSLHEYRHVVQMDQTRVGWGKYIYYLFGQSGTSVMQGLTNPWWFWEGDAVGSETVLGYGGRGRIPSFDLTFRTQLLTRGAFPYIKSACGSLKNAIPNHYLLGYLMTTYAKNHFGADVWSRVLTKTYSTPPIPFSFSKSIKKTIGLNVKQLYDSMTIEVKKLWQQQLDSVQETNATIIHHSPDKVFVNYKFPQYLPDGSIVAAKAGLETGSFLAYKSSIVDQSLFVLIDSAGKEHKLRISGVLDDNGVLSSNNDKIVWTEYTYDPRWGARNYTVIKTLDVKTKKIKQLTHRSRYHAPSFSPDGKMIVAIETSTSNEFSLVLLDASTGNLIKRFSNPGNEQYLQPHFSNDGKSIVMIKSAPGAKSIVRINVENGEIVTILKPINENISAPVAYKNYVLYNSPQTGIDNIYAVDTTNGNTYRITNRKFGAFNPNISPDEKIMSFQDFTPDGFRIATMPLIPTQWEKIISNTSDDEHKVEYFKLFSKEEAGNILAHVPDSTYPSKPYKRFKNAINVYGWGIDPLTNLPKVSLVLRSVDMLSTTTMEAGIAYDHNEKNLGKYFKLSYQGLYPQFFAQYTDGRRKTIFPRNSGVTTISNLHHDLIRFRNYSGGVMLPLNLSKGAYIKNFSFSSQVVYSEFSSLTRGNRRNPFRKARFSHLYYMQYDVAYEMRKRQSPRDVGPRAGTQVQFSHRNTPFASSFNAKQTAMDIKLYLPGISKHHAVKLRYYRQDDNNGNYHFENRYDFLRNINNRLFHRFDLWSADYKMPIAYPDKKILGGLLYFQRIKTDFFIEKAIGKIAFPNAPSANRKYTNIGMELTSDVNILRFLLPFDAGISASYLTQTKKINYGIVFKVPNIF